MSSSVGSVGVTIPTLVLPHSPALRGFSIQAVCSHSHGLKFPGWTILDGHHLLRAGDIVHNEMLLQ